MVNAPGIDNPTLDTEPEPLPQADPVLLSTPEELICTHEVLPGAIVDNVTLPLDTVRPLESVCKALNVCARFVSAMVPVLAGRLAVTEPKAPVTGSRVTVPLVAFPIVMLPSVPDAPNVGVAVQDDALLLVAFGTVPAVALVAFVPPPLMGTALAATVRDGVEKLFVTVGTSQEGQLAEGAEKEDTEPPPLPQAVPVLLIKPDESICRQL